MNPQVRDTLVNVAKMSPPGSDGIISYDKLNKHCNLNLDFSRNGRSEIGKILDEISKYEISGGRPLLSAVVVQQETMLPGTGFYELVDSLGMRLRGEDKTVTHIRLLTDVHKYWRTH